MKDVFVLNDTSGGHLGCNQVMKNLCCLIKKYSMNLLGTASKNQIENPTTKTLERIAKADLIIVNGEGTFHHSNETAQKIIEHCKDKHTVLINTVWDKMFLPNKDLLKNFDLISVRESLSYQQLVPFTRPGQLLITPDLFFYDTNFNEKIGYGDSVMASLRTMLSQQTNYFPLAPGSTMPSLHTYVAWLKSLELYVTGRFHGVCLSAMLNVPFLVLPSNCHKIEGLLKDMKCEELLLNSLDEIDNKKEIAVRLSIKAHNYTIKAKEKIKFLFNRIENILVDNNKKNNYEETI